jgi:hypothetical protein
MGPWAELWNVWMREMSSRIFERWGAVDVKHEAGSARTAMTWSQRQRATPAGG